MIWLLKWIEMSQMSPVNFNNVIGNDRINLESEKTWKVLLFAFGWFDFAVIMTGESPVGTLVYCEWKCAEIIPFEKYVEINSE